MLLKTATGLAFATACLSAHAAMPAYAATTGGSPQQNVVQSQRYDRLLETNRKFRDARERRECGPITDAELHQECLASFGQDEPYSGSSTPRHRTYHSSSGR
jgi:hypothetical protein